jgi:hypothetical protein
MSPDQLTHEDVLGTTEPLAMTPEDWMVGLIHATTRMRGMTAEEADAQFNPQACPEVTRLIRALLTPGGHICGVQRALGGAA